MHERRGLQGLAGTFPRQLGRTQPAQFVVDQRQQVLGCLSVAIFGGLEEFRYLLHECVDPPDRGCNGSSCGAGKIGTSWESTVSPRPGILKLAPKQIEALDCVTDRPVVFRIEALS